MCGICGVFNYGTKEPVNEVLVRRMNEQIAHRGPDGEGIYIDGQLGFGHKRLSIVDLTKGHQPMSNEDGSIWITFNGEIYNHADYIPLLKGKGHEFKTDCDTETIIHLYEEYGEDLLGKLNGMFAFAIWDRNKNSIFVARDRLGIKPLYYYDKGGRFLFGSEIKCILADESVERVPNYEAMGEYLHFYNALGDRTFFRDIELLEAGYYLIIKDGKVVKRQYWDVVDYEKYEYNDDKLIDMFAELLEDSVKLRLMSDVPVGSYLSGGIDSSTIAVIASKAYNGKFQTFSAGFDEGEDYDETKYADIVAGIIDSKHYKLYVDSADFPELLPKLIWYLDEPRIGAAIFPQYYISKLAAEHVKVCLGGQGADEIFAGYARYFYGTIYRSALQLAKNKVSSFAKNNSGGKVGSNIQKQYNEGVQNWLKQNFNTLLMPDRKRYYNQFRLLNDNLQSELLSQDMKRTIEKGNYYGKFNNVIERCKSKDPLDRLLYWDTKVYLNGLLMLEDRMSMANSLEARVPFLDYRIVEFAAKLPHNMKLNGLTTKYIVKKLVKRYLPDEIINKRKMGFPVPIKKWFEEEHRDWTMDVLSSKSTAERGIFNAKALSEVVNGKHSDDRYWERIVWTSLNMELWFRQFID